MLVATEWPAGDKTGFYPSTPLAAHQSGFRNSPGTTTVQADGSTVGVYLNSGDLTNGSHRNKMMIAPQYTVLKGQLVRPFATPTGAIETTLDLQVPTATGDQTPGSNIYVTADLSFIDPAGNNISYGCNLFFSGHNRARSHIGFDQDSHSIMVNGPVVAGNPWISPATGSAMHQDAPWRGWKHFKFFITQDNIRAALAELRAENPSTTASPNPADYSFQKFHLNAELHFGRTPVELGWSMRNATIEVVDSRS